MLLLESEWQPDRRPKATKISRQVYDSYVGQYRLSPNFNLGILIMRLILRNAPKSRFQLDCVQRLRAPIGWSSIRK
jgi:hypothetical protein